MRDEIWLKNKLSDIWGDYFEDIKQLNQIKIVFGRNARTRLGSIKMNKNKDTLITITGLFKNLEVPEFMIDATIAHEICHYSHGFASPHPKKARFPHKGGLVNRELCNRGFGEIIKLQKSWIKLEWPKISGQKRQEGRKKNIFIRILRSVR